MLAPLQTVLLATVLFAATNADDLVLLIVFFAQPGCRPRQVVLGSFLGLTVLTAASFAAAWLALAAPADWLPWLGLAPVVLGLRWLFHPHEDEAAPGGSSWRTVAVVTIANGADNLGVYIPAFAIQTFAQKVITAATFALLTFVLCGLAWTAVRHPTWGPRIRHWSAKLGPYVLIAIGLWVVAHHPALGLFL
jgi:cadmium resistance protein CadD (predicted permease)